MQQALQSFNAKVNAIIEWLASMPAEAFGFIALMVFGWILKECRRFPNELIPLTLIVAGVVVYTIVIPPSRAPQVAMDPKVFMGFLGLISAMFAWFIQAVVLVRLNMRGILAHVMKWGLGKVGLKEFYRPVKGDTDFIKKETKHKPDNDTTT